MFVMVEYRDAPGFPGYRVGSDGTTWSLWARKTGLMGYPHLMTGKITTGGYRVVTLYKDGKKYTRSVHRLILEAFVGPRPEGTQCCHRNGDSQDNRLENLRWGTSLSNHQDKVIHGTTARGENNPNAILTAEDIPKIREMYASGIVQTEIAAKFGVCQTTIGRILTRKLWASVA